MAWLKRGTESTIKDVFLRNIGACSLDDVNEWFKNSYANKYSIKGIDEAVELAKTFKDKQVTICGDYDSDGVTATTILLLSLRWAGFKNVTYRIPKRFSEGFGINKTMVDEIESGLIITCDNGVAQPEVINYAKEKGLTVIVTDHHQPMVVDGNDILPNADIIIDPNALDGQAVFNGYCGAGIAYKFACKMLDYNKTFCQKLLGLCAIGTVADVMELKEENYVFVRNGLKTLLMSTLCTSGLYALTCAFELNKHITAHDIGFKLGPAINASSRMKDDGAMDAVKLLSFDGPYPEAVAMAESFVAVNEQRKAAKKDALAIANKVIEDECLYGDIPMVLKVPGISEGVVGIIAGSLCEEYKVPVIVVTDSEDGSLKGSARSCGNYDIKAELDKCSDLLLRHGGHSGAAGLSLIEDNLYLLRETLINNVISFSCDSPEDIYYDLEINASEIPSMLEELKKYEPFGEGNPSPVFKVNNFSVVPRYGVYKKLIGSDLSIVKIYSKNTTAIGFDMAVKMRPISEPKCLNLIGTLSDNYFGGEIEHQIEFSDFANVEGDRLETPLAAKLRMMASAK